MANALRFLAADAVEQAKTGHPGMPLGMADIATVLFTRHLKYDAAAPHWPNRDRFVLSNGHGSMLLYGLLHLTGYEEATLDELKRFRKSRSRTAAHPEYGHMAGIETTTGPLGQGLATAVGMAIAERLLRAESGADVVDHRTWVFAGDGCLMEGVSQEAISLAGHLKLAKLTVVFDDNGTTIDGGTALATSDDQCKRFEASGWATVAIDGHDPAAIDQALAFARASDRPTMIAARTRIGFGAPTKEGQPVVHGSPLGAEELAGLRRNLGWAHAAFEVPESLRAPWREAGRRGAADRAAWEKRLAAAPAEIRAEFERRIAGRLPEGLAAAVKQTADETAIAAEAMPIRQGSQKALALLAGHLPELVGGSADLTGSVLSKPAGMAQLDQATFAGRHLPYGVREHGMAAAMNGIALHGGFIPYGGTYFTFSDYARPAIRLAALMGIKVVFLFTHDSIGVGEDGATHQPVEHLASLRAIPGLNVVRPADANETVIAWREIQRRWTKEYGKGAPHGLALTRQGVPVYERNEDAARGGYVLQEAEGGPARVVLIGTGSEVQLAVAAREQLQAEGVPTRVVSMPCVEWFDQQDQEYRDSVLPPEVKARVAVEAGIALTWYRFVGDAGRIVSLEHFGASADAKVLFREFGFTPEAVAAAARESLAAADR
jgi:transketolase